MAGEADSGEDREQRRSRREESATGSLGNADEPDRPTTPRNESAGERSSNRTPDRRNRPTSGQRGGGSGSGKKWGAAGSPAGGGHGRQSGYQRDQQRAGARSLSRGPQSGRRPSAGGESRRPLPRGEARPPQADRPDDPPIDEDVSFSQLDRQARQRLRTLSKDSATRVGRHLVMAGLLVEEDPELAYQHAHSAMRRAGRVDVVREAVALTAYATGRYAEALREIRTVRRLSGLDALRAIEADCERGLGRPERALDLASAPASKDMTDTDRVELAIVASGARLDLEQPDAALLVLDQQLVLDVADPQMAERVAHARVAALRAAGRTAEAEALSAQIPEPTPEDEDIVFAELAQETPGPGDSDEGREQSVDD